MNIFINALKKQEYFEILEKYDIDKLSDMIRELQLREIEKMREYDVDNIN